MLMMCGAHQVVPGMDFLTRRAATRRCVAIPVCHPGDFIMSAGEPECPRCRLYLSETAVLRAEIATLQQAVLALTSQRTESAAALEIVGMHEPQRLTITGPFVDGSDRFYRVSIAHRDQLSARCEVPIEDPAMFLRFFEDLAQHKAGWHGQKMVASAEGQLAISCTYGGKGLRPEISMDASCALDDPGFDPYWMVQLHLDVDPASLDQLAAQARVIFTEAAAGESGRSPW